MGLLTLLALLCWAGLLLLPWRPWSTREQLEADPGASVDLGDITALLPARDEAGSIARTLRALAAQGNLARIVLVDDQSEDGTGDIARGLGLANLEVLNGSDPPPGWSGKLWALEQGRRQVASGYVLLLDADIELAPGMLATLERHRRAGNLALASIMAHLHMETVWERLLLPPFVYFFKLIYPFALANRPASRVAAAAGGCILLERKALDGIGGFAALHDAIIDDCTLAQRVKRAGGSTWVGLSHGVRAIRPYGTLANIWNMVARTAYTQLHYSPLLLGLCTALLLLTYGAPFLGLVGGHAWLASAALAAMAASYLPTVRYYGLPDWWTVTLPLAAVLFLAMTWTSALRYWSGERSRWKRRSYERAGAPRSAHPPGPEPCREDPR